LIFKRRPVPLLFSKQYLEKLEHGRKGRRVAVCGPKKAEQQGQNNACRERIHGTLSRARPERPKKKRSGLRGDRSMPVVTMAWNADRFSGRNLAFRLVALGYTNVIWYRGGREAWEVAGLPETEVVVQEW
jgi:hypothetical protein